MQYHSTVLRSVYVYGQSILFFQHNYGVCILLNAVLVFFHFYQEG